VITEKVFCRSVRNRKITLYRLLGKYASDRYYCCLNNTGRFLHIFCYQEKGLNG